MTFQLKVPLKIKLLKKLIDVIFCPNHFTSGRICFLYSCAPVYADAVPFYCVLLIMSSFSNHAVNVYVCLPSSVLK